MAKLSNTPSRSTLIAAIVLVGLALDGQPVGAQTALRWKFEPGETLRYRIELKNTLRITPPEGRPAETKMTQTFDTVWTVGDVKDGIAEMTLRFDRIRSTIDSNYGKFSHDTKDRKKPEGQFDQKLAPVMEALIGSPFSFKMDERGEVTDVIVPEKLAKVLKEPPMVGGGMISEESFRSMIVQSTLPLPSEPVSKGKSWSKIITIPSGPLGSHVLDNTFTDDGPVSDSGGDLEKILLKTKLDFKTSEDVQVVPKVTSHDSHGQFLFDVKKGRLAESEVTQKMGLSFALQEKEIVQENEVTSTMKLEPGEPSK